MGNGSSSAAEPPTVISDSRTSLTREFRVAKHAPRAERAAVRAYLRRAGEHQKEESGGIVSGGKGQRGLGLQLEPEAEEDVDRYGEEETESLALSFDEPVVSRKALFDRHELAQQRELYPDAVSIMSFNVLANMYVSRPRKKDLYSHCPKQYLDWHYRVRMILRSLGEMDADIICLQEVEMEAYETDFKPVLKARGYSAAFHNDALKRKNKDPIEIPGQAIFMKKKGWEPKWQIQSYRALVAAFEVTDPRHTCCGKVLAIVCVHLEGNPKRHKDRANQLRSVLSKLWKRKDDWDYSIVCGDFNTDLTDPECESVKVLQKYRYVSVYKTKCLNDPTCILTPWDSPDQNAVHVDHIFYTSKQLIRRGVTRIIDAEWNRNMVLIEGLPSKKWPSDHFSIATVLELKPLKDKPKLPYSKSKTAAKGGKESTKERTEDDLVTEVKKRLEAVKSGLSTSEFEQWDALQEPELNPGHKGGLLSKEEIQERRERSKARQELVDGLDGDKKALVKAYTNAQKELKKSKKNTKKQKNKSEQKKT